MRKENVPFPYGRSSSLRAVERELDPWGDEPRVAREVLDRAGDAVERQPGSTD